jgi:AcrR family transcriptional regulator
VYTYFGTLGGLLLELLQRESSKFEFMALAQLESDLPVSKWVQQAATLYLDAAQEMGPLFLALFQDRSVDAELEKARSTRHKLMIQLTAQRLADGTGAPRTESKAAAALLLGALHGGAEAIVRGGLAREPVESTYQTMSRNVVSRLKRLAARS